MLRRLASLGAVAVLVLTLGVTGCSDEDCETCPPSEKAPELAYVSSETCGTAGCHESTYATFIESGHPYKLTEVMDATAPTYPFDDLHNHTVEMNGPPPGTTWGDFAYVIGGYGWKARWVKPDGRVYTAGTEAQLNLHAPAGESEWVPYHQDEDKPYNYGCFKCHTTGASEEGSWPEGETGWGTFAFGGVQCEECHGQGSQHAFDPQTFAMTVDRSSAACGKCHTRDAQNRVAVSGGFIRHHEQYDELIHSPHTAVGCGGCHDPHASVVHDDTALGNGVIAECISCHEGYDTNLMHSSFDCVSCHMPDAAKSARKDHEYKGDVSSHLFTIRTTAEGKDAMWTSDGKFVALDEFGRGSLTLDFACYSCHNDGAGNGGNAPTLDLDALSARAQIMHSGGAARVSMK